jgi:adenylate kinase family enzyme
MKILIFGIPGSGKTILARRISNSLSLPLFHIDKMFFEKGWIERDHDHFLEDIKSVLQKSDWILDGNGMRSLEMRFKEANIAIYCNLPRLLCLFRVFYRWISTLYTIKDDGPEGSSNTVSWKLIKYLWCFSKKYKKSIDELKMKYPKVQFIEAQSQKEIYEIAKKLISSSL